MMNRYIYFVNVLLSLSRIHSLICRNDKVLKWLMCFLLFIFVYLEYYVFLADLIPLCSTPARCMPDRQPFHLSASFSNS